MVSMFLFTLTNYAILARLEMFSFFFPIYRNTISKNVRGDRGAILTTHSMEEADALSSRVGIMVKGEMK